MLPREHGEYRVEPFTPDLLPGMATVLELLLGANRDRAREYIEWKHLRGPRADDGVLLAVTHGSPRRVVGMTGFTPAPYRVGGRQVRLACWADFVVSPDHQRHGLGTLLLQCSMEELERRHFVAAISLSHNPVSTVVSRRTGWRPVGDATFARLGGVSGVSMAKPSWPKRLLRRGYRAIRARTGRRSRSSFPRFDRRSTRRGAFPGGIEPSREPRPTEMAALAARCADPDRLERVHDEAYFRWRFANPVSGYRFLSLRRGDTLRGFMVLQEFARQRDGRVAFLDVTADSPAVAAELVQHSLDAGGFRHVAMLAHGISDAVAASLERAGFRFEGPRRGVPSLIVRPLGEVATGGPPQPLPDNLMSLDAWRLQLIDSDAF